MRTTDSKKTARVALGLVVTSIVILLGGCSSDNPGTTVGPSGADVGAGTEIGSGDQAVRLSQFMVVGAGQGSTGTVVGAILNSRDEPVKVTLSVLDSSSGAASGSSPLAETTLTVGPRELAEIGPEGTQLQLRNLPVAPGGTLSMKASATPGGEQRFSLPVMAPTGEYASLTATPDAP